MRPLLLQRVMSDGMIVVLMVVMLVGDVFLFVTGVDHGTPAGFVVAMLAVAGAALLGVATVQLVRLNRKRRC